MEDNAYLVCCSNIFLLVTYLMFVKRVGSRESMRAYGPTDCHAIKWSFRLYSKQAGVRYLLNGKLKCGLVITHWER
jgi:hypothetical protein